MENGKGFRSFAAPVSGYLCALCIRRVHHFIQIAIQCVNGRILFKLAQMSIDAQCHLQTGLPEEPLRRFYVYPGIMQGRGICVPEHMCRNVINHLHLGACARSGLDIPNISIDARKNLQKRV